MKLRSRALLLVCVLAATAVLAALGFWQVERLQWKEALIAEVEARRSKPAATLAELEASLAAGEPVEFRPVRVSGQFDHARELYFYATGKGEVGWEVITPLTLDDGRTLLVDRGFVPYALRDPATRRQGLVEGTIAIEGLVREPRLEKPNRFVPDNRPDKREFYWKDFVAMITAAKIPDDKAVRMVVDSGPAPVPGGWPRGGATIVEFSNSHLQYAITWFGLAAACLGVGLTLLLSPAYRRG